MTSPTPPSSPGPQRELASDAINRAIRTFVSSRGEQWSAEDRLHLARLYDAWAAHSLVPAPPPAPAPAPDRTRRPSQP
ncbi:hypothetical protein AB0O69_13285 [Streptomyces xiamenensis]|uniref:hypothetical protein n=1 Tax=Streptomyces xiamenensis TaxID=408015 RepID=UPI0034232A61